jgi:hypothetical protein
MGASFFSIRNVRPAWAVLSVQISRKVFRRGENRVCVDYFKEHIVLLNGAGK